MAHGTTQDWRAFAIVCALGGTVLVMAAWFVGAFAPVL